MRSCRRSTHPAATAATDTRGLRPTRPNHHGLNAELDARNFSRRRAVAKAQPQCQADSRSWVRREVCDHGPVRAPGEGRYHWTVTVFGETDPVAGRTGELGKARSQAEGALLAYVEGGNDGPWALSWRLCRFLPTVGMRELLTQRDGHLCYGFVVQCRDRGRVRTDNLLGPGWQIERQDHLLTGARRCAYRITPAAR